jgi:hypothetical protein
LGGFAIELELQPVTRGNSHRCCRRNEKEKTGATPRPM